jgi:hypothetical protein
MLRHFLFWIVVLGVIYMVGGIEVIFPISFIPAMAPKPIEQQEKDK